MIQRDWLIVLFDVSHMEGELVASFVIFVVHPHAFQPIIASKMVLATLFLLFADIIIPRNITGLICILEDIQQLTSLFEVTEMLLAECIIGDSPESQVCVSVGEPFLTLAIDCSLAGSLRTCSK